MKRTITELCKNIIIVLLICTMVLLLVASLPAAQIRQTPWLSKLLQPLAPVLGLPEAELAYVETALPVTDAAMPVAVSVNNAAGRHTAMWDRGTLDTAFENLGGFLGQALDTARHADAAELHQVTRALSDVSVLFSYDGSLPAGLLAAWLDANLEEAAETEVSALILAVEDEAAALYLVGERILRAETEVSAVSLENALSEYMPDHSMLAFEVNDHLAPLSVLPGQDQTVAAVTRANPVNKRLLESLASALGFNPYGDASYTDAAGDTWFTETGSSLQVTAGGRLILTTAADRFTAADTQIESLAEEARRLVELAAGESLGDARMYMTSIQQQENETLVNFSCIVNGIPVDGAGAVVTFAGSSVTRLELRLVTYTVRSGTLQLLPPVQAAALLPAGAQLRLAYSDSGERQLTAGWIKP